MSGIWAFHLLAFLLRSNDSKAYRSTNMRYPSATRYLTLLIAALLLVVLETQAFEDVQAPLQAVPQPDSTAANAHNDKPKLFKPKTGIMKEEHDVDPGNQRARADDIILENAEEYQPESERVIDSLEDLRSVQIPSL